ncbi:MAG: LicD family protein, partial [Clostridia bacterium]|nr:LicD family protein [Clostridia bacterium]
MEYNRNIEMARRIAQCVAGAGGTVYYVGGMVRDRLMGVGQKAPDVDIEVHGIVPEKLEAILDTLGERQMFGASFGIYNLRHYNIDIAMPRQDYDRLAEIMLAEEHPIYKLLTLQDGTDYFYEFNKVTDTRTRLVEPGAKIEITGLG